MPTPTDPTNPPSVHHVLDVRGALPLTLAGRMVAISPDGLVHSFDFDGGRVSYLARSIRMSTTAAEVVAFEGSLLVHGEDSSIRQLLPDADTLRRVDLAGHRRTVTACPKYDPATGELHLVARDWDGAQLHVVVPAGALTRRSRPIADARERIHGLAIGSEHLVVVADGVAGVGPRDGEGRMRWMATGAVAPRPVHTHPAGDAVVLFALAPSLERWILHPDDGVIERELLDPTARHLVVAPDPRRPDHIDSAWCIALVQGPSTTHTDLRVSAATAVTETIATIHIPRPIPDGLRCTWMPATQQ